MRLILVHGIHQQGKSEESLKTEWLGHLDAALGRPDSTAAIEVSAPFYGDLLKTLTDGGGTTAIAQGVDTGTDSEALAFYAAALTEQAQAAGIGASAIAAEQRTQAREGGDLALEQGFPMHRRINAIVRVIERLSPVHGGIVMRLLKQAFAYLRQPGVGGQIDAIVRPVIDRGPAVIVAHSLGTVVTFKLLRQMALEKRPAQVPLLVTVGSPLPLMAVQASLGPVFAVPEGVGRWINGVDPDDFIALGRGLDPTSFADGIENLLDIDNLQDDAHAIEGYLRDPRIAAAIAEACGL